VNNVLSDRTLLEVGRHFHAAFMEDGTLTAAHLPLTGELLGRLRQIIRETAYHEEATDLAAVDSEDQRTMPCRIADVDAQPT